MLVLYILLFIISVARRPRFTGPKGPLELKLHT